MAVPSVACGADRVDRLGGCSARCDVGRDSPASAGPLLMSAMFADGPGSMMPVADQLFFVAHHDRDGRPRLHQRAVALGLAGALLGELVLLGHLDVYDSAVYVVHREPPHDALDHSILS